VIDREQAPSSTRQWRGRRGRSDCSCSSLIRLEGAGAGARFWVAVRGYAVAGRRSRFAAPRARAPAVRCAHSPVAPHSPVRGTTTHAPPCRCRQAVPVASLAALGAQGQAVRNLSTGCGAWAMRAWHLQQHAAAAPASLLGLLSAKAGRLLGKAGRLADTDLVTAAARGGGPGASAAAGPSGLGAPSFAARGVATRVAAGGARAPGAAAAAGGKARTPPGAALPGGGGGGGGEGGAPRSPFERWWAGIKAVPPVPRFLGFAGIIPFIALAPPVSKHLFWILPHDVIDNSAMFQVGAQRGPPIGPGRAPRRGRRLLSASLPRRPLARRWPPSLQPPQPSCCRAARVPDLARLATASASLRSWALCTGALRWAAPRWRRRSWRAPHASRTCERRGGWACTKRPRKQAERAQQLLCRSAGRQGRAVQSGALCCAPLAACRPAPSPGCPQQCVPAQPSVLSRPLPRPPCPLCPPWPPCPPRPLCAHPAPSPPTPRPPRPPRALPAHPAPSPPSRRPPRPPGALPAHPAPSPPSRRPNCPLARWSVVPSLASFSLAGLEPAPASLLLCVMLPLVYAVDRARSNYLPQWCACRRLAASGAARRLEGRFAPAPADARRLAIPPRQRLCFTPATL
jgi:hypothetical protein